MSISPPPNGILLVDKPSGITSHGVVSKVRKLAGTKKVGHAGTLDPMATGLLMLGLGPSTRLLTFLVGLDKEYLATIRLGASTTTDDAEGDILGYVSSAQADRVTDQDIHAGILRLTGDIEQVPSTYSAIKVDGKRAYSLAREGKSVDLKARKVKISLFEVESITRTEDEAGHPFIDLDVRVQCSSGTYIRALARDVGFFLGIGGHLTRLRRTKIGDFHVMDAVDIDNMAGQPDLLEPSKVASKMFPTVELNNTQAQDLQHGKTITLEGFPDSPTPTAAISPDGKLIGLVTVKNNRSHIVVNFPTESDFSTHD